MRDTKYPIFHPIVSLVKLNNGGILTSGFKGIEILLTPSQTVLFSQIDGNKSITQLTENLSSSYNIPIEKVFEDTNMIIDKFERRGMLILLERPINGLHEIKHGNILPEDFDNRAETHTSENLNTLCIALTDKCDYNCIYCLANSNNNCTDVLPFKVIENVIIDAVELGTTTLNLTGGDPLLHKNLIDICNRAVDLGIREIGISTKGWRLNKDKVKDLKKKGIKNLWVRII